MSANEKTIKYCAFIMLAVLVAAGTLTFILTDLIYDVSVFYSYWRYLILGVFLIVSFVTVMFEFPYSYYLSIISSLLGLAKLMWDVYNHSSTEIYHISLSDNKGVILAGEKNPLAEDNPKDQLTNFILESLVNDTNALKSCGAKVFIVYEVNENLQAEAPTPQQPTDIPLLKEFTEYLSKTTTPYVVNKDEKMDAQKKEKLKDLKVHFFEDKTLKESTVEKITSSTDYVIKNFEEGISKMKLSKYPNNVFVFYFYGKNFSKNLADGKKTLSSCSGQTPRNPHSNEGTNGSGNPPPDPSNPQPGPGNPPPDPSNPQPGPGNPPPDPGNPHNP